MHFLPSRWCCLGKVLTLGGNSCYVSSKSLGGRPLQVIHTPSYNPSLHSGPPWYELSTYILVGTAILSVPCFSHHGGKRPLWNCDPKLTLLLFGFSYIFCHMIQKWPIQHSMSRSSFCSPCIPSQSLDSQPHASVFLCVMRIDLCHRTHLKLGIFFFWVTVLCSSGWLKLIK